MAQGGAGGNATNGTLLRNGTGGRGVVVVRGLGNGLGLGTGAPVTGIGFGTRRRAGSGLGHGAAVPAVGTGAPSAVVAVPPAGLHGIHTAGRIGYSQVRGLVPLIVPAVGGIAAVHSAENHIGVARRDGTGIDTVALRGHTDPFVCASTVVEEISSKTGAVTGPFAVDLQNQLRGRGRFCFCRPRHAKDYTDRADQQQDT